MFIHQLTRKLQCAVVSWTKIPPQEEKVPILVGGPFFKSCKIMQVENEKKGDAPTFAEKTARCVFCLSGGIALIASLFFFWSSTPASELLGSPRGPRGPRGSFPPLKTTGFWTKHLKKHTLHAKIKLAGRQFDNEKILLRQGWLQNASFFGLFWMGGGELSESIFVGFHILGWIRLVLQKDREVSMVGNLPENTPPEN